MLVGAKPHQPILADSNNPTKSETYKDSPVRIKDIGSPPLSGQKPCYPNNTLSVIASQLFLNMCIHRQDQILSTLFHQYGFTHMEVRHVLPNKSVHRFWCLVESTWDVTDLANILDQVIHQIPRHKVVVNNVYEVVAVRNILNDLA